MVHTNTKVLGVLGGMGPLASAHFMLRLTEFTPASIDQQHIPTVLWSDPRVPDRNKASVAKGADPLPYLLRGIVGLRRAGCNAIAIPCNTAHGWYDEMLAVAGCPILHIVDAAAADLRRLCVTSDTIGIMGTQATLDMQLYQHRLDGLGWRCLRPTAEEMEQYVSPAIALVKANRVADAFAPAAKVIRLLSSRGARAVVLGCTELPLAVRAGTDGSLETPIVDSIDALARAAIDWARKP